MSGEHRLVPVFVSNSAIEAEELRCLLEGSGLTAFVFDARLPAMIPALAAPLGGVRVMVPEDQLEHAAEVLRDAGRLEGDLPLTGKAPHPYVPPRAGRSYAIAGLVIVAIFFLITLATMFLR
jgi:hypothetical protein